jgi:flagellar assembly protein FliH
VFKPTEIFTTAQIKQIELPERYQKNVMSDDEYREFEVDEDGNPIDMYQGPSIEEMEAELERYRRETEEEVQRMLQDAQERARQIEEEGRNASFRELQNAREQIKLEMEKFRQESDREVERGKFEAEKMIKEAELKVSEIEHEAYKKGYEAGREEGYKEGQAEVLRLIDRLGTIISTAVDIRDDIIKSSERMMTEMILMIARKVIKDEIVERREVVINNIKEALRRVKDRDRIDIRVNFADLDMTTAHKDELIKMMESLKKVNFYEDSRVDRGGCIIETDVGSIDARYRPSLTRLKKLSEIRIPCKGAGPQCGPFSVIIMRHKTDSHSIVCSRPGLSFCLRGCAVAVIFPAAGVYRMMFRPAAGHGQIAAMLPGQVCNAALPAGRQVFTQEQAL